MPRVESKIHWSYLPDYKNKIEHKIIHTRKGKETKYYFRNSEGYESKIYWLASKKDKREAQIYLENNISVYRLHLKPPFDRWFFEWHGGYMTNLCWIIKDNKYYEVSAHTFKNNAKPKPNILEFRSFVEEFELTTDSYYQLEEAGVI